MVHVTEKGGLAPTKDVSGHPGLPRAKPNKGPTKPKKKTAASAHRRKFTAQWAPKSAVEDGPKSSE